MTSPPTTADVVGVVGLECGVCRERVDGDGPAVGRSVDADGEARSHWIEFVQDLRTSGSDLVHPHCFATAEGVDALIEVVHRRDLKERGVVPRLMGEIRELEHRLRRAGPGDATR